MPYSKPVTKTHYHCSDMENEKYMRKHFLHFFIRHPSFGPSHWELPFYLSTKYVSNNIITNVFFDLYDDFYPL